MSKTNRPSQTMRHGPMRGRGPAEKAKDFKGTMKKTDWVFKTLSFKYYCCVYLYCLFCCIYGYRT